MLSEQERELSCAHQRTNPDGIEHCSLDSPGNANASLVRIPRRREELKYNTELRRTSRVLRRSKRASSIGLSGIKIGRDVFVRIPG